MNRLLMGSALLASLHLPISASAQATPVDARGGGAVAAAALRAAAQGVTGRVLARSGPVAGAEIHVDGEPATLAAGDGRFRVPLTAAGAVRVSARALGFSTASLDVTVSIGAWTEVELLLEESAIPLDPIVVTGTLSETRVSDSPVKVDVVSARMLRRNASSSLMEAVGQINGLYQQVDCGVCYTNNIRINGMEGPYTAVLIDGMPIMGALASVYGLNGIHPAAIERLEILKGPQSTLYGTEAMGGVVNVITKDPRFSPRYAVEGTRNDLGQSNLTFSLAPGGARTRSLLSGSLTHNGRFLDDNGDGFSDVTLETRLALFGKTQILRAGKAVVGLTAKLYHEDRFGGAEGWTDADRGSASVYGESILTNRAEVMARVATPWPDVRAHLSYAFHDQDSFYGNQSYDAVQHIGFAQLLWDPARGESRHDLLAGATLRAQSYDDDTPATARPDRRVIPGVFVEDQFSPHPAWTLLGGLRVDHHDRHGAIASPRASAMWRPTERTTLRLNAGTGFRVVDLFTEDHAALTGSRELVIEGALRPERSRSLAVNLNREIEFGANPMMIDVDFFRTRFSNRILPDYDVDPNQIVYRNLEGRHAVSRGVSLSLNQNFGAHLPLLYSAGITAQDVFIDGGAEGRVDEMFAPSYRGVWTVSYTVGGDLGAPGSLTLDWSGNVTGPMRLPEYDAPFTRPTRSDPYAIHNLQASWSPAPGREIVLGVRNLGDFRQGSPLVDSGNPFGEAFDTNYVWAPIVGRTITLGVRLAGSR